VRQQTKYDQLIAVRLQKHNEYLNIKKDTKETVIVETTTQPTRKRVFVCGDSMLNSLESNGLSSKKCNTQIRSFSGATSADLIKLIEPSIEKNPDHIILHIGTNDLTKPNIDTKRNIIQIIDNIKRKNVNTKISLSTICLREDRKILNKKRIELNKEIDNIVASYGLTKVCNENVDSSCLAKKKLHLNRKGVARFAKNLKSCAWKDLNWQYEEISDTIDNSVASLKSLRLKYPKNVILSYININSIRNKLDSLGTLVSDEVDILAIAESKLDDSFPISSFQLHNFKSPYRLDITDQSGGILVFVRSNIPSRQLTNYKYPKDIQIIPMEINLRKRVWLILNIYRNPTQNIAYFLENVYESILFYSKYENIIITWQPRASLFHGI